MAPRTEDSISHDFDSRIADKELEGIMERVHSVVTDPMWSVSLHRNQVKVSIDSMAVLTMMRTPTNPTTHPHYRYWDTQRWSVVVIQSDQQVLYKHVAHMMELIASWAVTSVFELHGMAKQSAWLVADDSVVKKHMTSGSGTLTNHAGKEIQFTVADELHITRIDNQKANTRRGL